MKKAIFIITFLLLNQYIYCNEIDNKTLYLVIKNWISQSELFQKKNPTASVANIEKLQQKNDALCLISLSPYGYIIATNNDKLPVVVSFSTEKSIHAKDLEEGPLSVLLDGTAQKITELLNKQDNDPEVMANKNAWGALKVDPTTKRKSAKTTLVNPTVDSFMDVHWGQAKPYNRYAPNCASQDEAHEKRTPAGCIALAMSQVMKYYNWPTRGIGQKYYTNTGDIKSDFCSDFSLPYNWNQITARYNQAHIPDTDLGKQAVGKLVFDTGISVNMNFTCKDASAGFAFYTFGKQLLYGNTEEIKQTDFTTAKETILKLQPVLLGIPGHAVVIDGYSMDNETEYFHINYGWGDISDGWYNLAGGNPAVANMYKGFMPQPVAVTKQPKYTQTSGFTLEWDIPQYYAEGIEGFTIDNFRVKQGEWGTQTGNITTPNKDWKTEMDCGISDGTITFSASWNPAASITSEAYIATPSTNLSYSRRMNNYNSSSVLYTEIETDNSGIWTKINEDRFTEIEKTVNLSLAQYAGKSIKIRFSRFKGEGYFYTVNISNLLLSDVRTVDWTIIADNLPASTKSYQVNNLTAEKKYQFRMESKLNNQWYASPIIDEVNIVEAEDQAPVINTENNQTEFCLDYTNCSIPLEISDDKTSSDQLEVKAFYCSRPDVFNTSLSRFIPAENGKGILKLYPRTRAGNTLLGIIVKDAAGNITKKLISVELKEGSIPEPTSTSYYVTQTGNGDYSGTSWENASSDLTVMLDLADRTVSETKPAIHVASGTYYGDFIMAEGVNVYGGYDPKTNKQDLNKKSIIDGNRIRILTQLQDFTTPTTWSGFEFINGGTGRTDSKLGSAVLLRAGGIINQCSMHDNSINTAVYCNKGGTVMNSVIYKNKDNLVVSGLYLNDGTAKAVNCVIANNGGSQGISVVGAGSIENCIIWGNPAEIASTATCSYSALPTQITGDGNIVLGANNDAPNGPNFADPDNGNYALLAASPCVNKGSNILNHSEFDFAGSPRIQFQTVDMGAYELQNVIISAGKTVNLDTYTVNNVFEGDLILYNTGSAVYTSDVIVNGKISFIRSFDSSEKWYPMVCPYAPTLYAEDTAIAADKFQLRKQIGESMAWEDITNIQEGQPFLIKVAPELIGKELKFVSQAGLTISANPIIADVPANQEAFLLCGSASLKSLTPEQGKRFLPTKEDPEWFQRTFTEQASIAPFNTYLLANTKSSADLVNIDGTTKEQVLDLYVTPEGAGNKSGSSWKNASNDLQEAMNQATQVISTTGYKSKVFVSSGTFTGNFKMVEGVDVHGGFNPETGLQDFKQKTVLNGNGTRTLTQSNKFSTATIWENFEITNGGKGPEDGTWNFGGGVLLYENGIIDKCYIHGNLKGDQSNIHHGGGVCCHTGDIVMNSIIANNRSMYNGSGVFLHEGGGKAINCVIANNSGAGNGGATIWHGSLINSIVWKNGLLLNGGTILNSASDNTITEDTNILLNTDNDAPDGPNFTDWENGDYTLKHTSICINKGINNEVISKSDYAGNPRIRLGNVDMGAYEWQKSYLYNAETGEISLFEWTPSFDTDVKPEEVTSIDATGITVPQGASLPAALSPNCLLYVNNAENTSSLKNVVVSDGQNGTAETIELTDGYPFYNTRNITVANISYSRNFLDGWNTVALPFGLNAVGEETIEEFNTVTGDIAKFTKVTATEANTAYLIKIAEASTKVFSATGDVKVPPTASTGAVFKSTFKKLTGDAIVGKYILSIQNEKETFAKASSQAGAMPFRGYLELSGGLDSRFKVIHSDGGATGIYETDGAENLIIYSANGILTIITDRSQSVKLYSIDGRLIKNVALQTGINTVEGLAKGIYLVNNQKVVIK